MEERNLLDKIQQLIREVEKMIPSYLENEEDRIRSKGGSAMCIIDQGGNVHGKMFGTELIQARECFRIAWVKASQVHITGYPTEDFEKGVYSGQIDDKPFGIRRPDFIGWQGGQPVQLKDGTRLSIAFSGFRGIMDLEIVTRALAKMESDRS
jgi:glc operon protein GlcG